jgi:hypothetical protein
MTLEDRVHTLRLRLFRRAEELGNVSEACREAGASSGLGFGATARRDFIRSSARPDQDGHRSSMPWWSAR